MEKLLSPDTGLIIWTLVIFSFLVVVLGKFAWKPLIDSIEERDFKIKDSIDSARKCKNEMEELKGEYLRKLEQNEVLFKEILEKARYEAEIIRSEIIAKSKEESREIFKKAQEALEREREKLMEDIRKEILGVSIDAAEKLIKNSVNKEIQEKFLNEFLDDMDKYSKKTH